MKARGIRCGLRGLVPGPKSPRQGVLSGSAKFAGTFKRLDLAAADITFDAYGRGRSRVLANGVIGVRGVPDGSSMLAPGLA